MKGTITVWICSCCLLMKVSQDTAMTHWRWWMMSLSL